MSGDLVGCSTPWRSWSSNVATIQSPRMRPAGINSCPLSNSDPRSPRRGTMERGQQIPARQGRATKTSPERNHARRSTHHEPATAAHRVEKATYGHIGSHHARFAARGSSPASTNDRGRVSLTQRKEEKSTVLPPESHAPKNAARVGISVPVITLKEMAIDLEDKSTLSTAPQSQPCKSAAGVGVSVPVLPLKALAEASELDGASSRRKFEEMTPHGLTDRALKKSELLLAELSALGLSDEVDFGVPTCVREDSESSDEEVSSLASSLSPAGRSSSLARLQLNDFAGKAASPLICVDLHTDKCPTYPTLLCSSPWPVTKSSSECTASCQTTQPHEPEPEMFPSFSSSNLDDVLPLESSLGLCSWQAQASPLCRAAASPWESSPRAAPPTFAKGNVSPRVAQGIAPPRVSQCAPPAIRQQSRGESVADRRKSLPATYAPGANRYTQVSQAISPRPPTSPLLMAGPKVAVDVPAGCRPVACSVEQTITIQKNIALHIRIHVICD